MGAPGGLFHAVGSFFGSIVGSVAMFVSGILKPILPGVSQFIFDYIVEPIMLFLGFQDEDVYHTSIIAVKVFDEDLYTRTQLRLATEYMKKESVDALSYAKNFASTGDTQFNKYYRHGKWYYIDYLPEIQISCTTIKQSEVQNILKNIHNDSSIFIDDIGVMVPSDDDWCKWRLQEVYNYNVGDDYLIINNVYYYYGGCRYDSGQFVVTLRAMTAIKTRVIETVKASVAGTANVEVSSYAINEYERVDETQIRVTSYTRIEYVWNNEVIQSEETSHLITYVDDTTTEDRVDKELLASSTNTYDIQRIIVTQTTIKSSVNTGVILSQTTKTISDTQTVVLEGSGETYTTETQISEVDTPTGWTDRTTTIAYHDNIRRYVVKYSSKDTGRYYLFIYNTLDGTYPALSNPVNVVQGLEGYPIVMLRNGFNDINNYKNSGQYGQGKPPTISEKRYKATKELMSTLGLDVDDVIKGYSNNPDIDKLQDCFYLYGVSPSDNHWVVSRVLYEMFDFIYDKMPYTGFDNNYSATFKENPYNASIIWKATYNVIKTEKIGSLGTCKHYISGTTLTIKKQITTTTTKTITLKDTATFSIIRGSYNGYSSGEALDISNENLVIPVPVMVVNRLTLMEKTALLGRSSYLLFYAFQQQHIKWYQTEDFANYMSTMGIIMSITIGVIVTVATLGAGTALTLSTFATGLFKTALIAGALQLALYVINEAVQDVNLKIALSIIASLGAMALGGAFTNIDFGTVLRLAELPIMAADIYMNDMQANAQSKLQMDVGSFQAKYENITEQYSEMIKGFSTGLTTESAVGLAVDATEDYNTSSDRGFMLSPSQFYSMATTACYNYDALYTGYYDACVHRFVRDRKMLGVFNDEGDE